MSNIVISFLHCFTSGLRHNILNALMKRANSCKLNFISAGSIKRESKVAVIRKAGTMFFESKMICDAFLSKQRSVVNIWKLNSQLN